MKTKIPCFSRKQKFLREIKFDFTFHRCEVYKNRVSCHVLRLLDSGNKPSSLVELKEFFGTDKKGVVILLKKLTNDRKAFEDKVPQECSVIENGTTW